MTTFEHAGMICSRNEIITGGNLAMHTEKLSISLPDVLFNFIEEYQNAHACKSRSEVVQMALKLLQERELEQFYQEAATEIDIAFDNTASDGLDDETW